MTAGREHIESPDQPFSELILGVHDVRIPVSDSWVSRDWYMSVLAFEPLLDLEEAAGVIGVVLRHPSGAVLGLHQDPPRAAAMRGFVTCVLAVADRAALEDAAGQLDAIGEAHTAISQGHLGWYLDLPDPDGIVVRLHTFTSVDAEEA